MEREKARAIARSGIASFILTGCVMSFIHLVGSVQNIISYICR